MNYGVFFVSFDMTLDDIGSWAFGGMSVNFGGTYRPSLPSYGEHHGA